MKHFLLLLLRNATKHNSTKFSAARLHVSFDKFWNCLKDLKCNNVKNSCLLVDKRTLCSTKLKNICKTFYRLNMQRIPKEISEINTSFTLHEMHVACRILVHHHSFHFFFNHPTSIKWFVSWTVGNRLLKPLCGKMLGWLNFRLGELIGLIHALEKRYYQNKTQLRYNFGSVYVLMLCKSSCRQTFTCFVSLLLLLHVCNQSE